MLVCVFLVHFAHETAGAARTRSSLRPLYRERVKRTANLGRPAPRECGRSFLRHCERSDAIHVSACGGMDCFVAALLAMTTVGLTGLSCLTIKSEVIA